MFFHVLFNKRMTNDDGSFYKLSYILTGKHNQQEGGIRIALQDVFMTINANFIELQWQAF